MPSADRGETAPGRVPHSGDGAPTCGDRVGERWALWPDGTMCPAAELEAMLRPPCAFSDDFQWVWVMSDRQR
jgi:hypothetical protein